MPNASLDDFGDGEEAGTDQDPDTDDEASDRPSSEAAPNRPAVTYAWSPEGSTCGLCGQLVERRWRENDTMVCADCKSW